MQIEPEDMEKRLRGFEPKRPSAFLKARIAAEMEKLEETAERGEGPKSRAKFVWGTTLTALVSAMAAVWAVLLVLDHRPGSPRMGEELGVSTALNDGRSQAVSFEVAARPIDRFATLLNAEPSPVYFLENGMPVQNVALRFLDTEVWEMEDTEETFTVRKVRDEVRVVPVESF